MQFARSAIQDEEQRERILLRAKRLPFPEGDVRIWLVDLDLFSPGETECARESLGEPERRRAKNFRFAEARQRYVAAHCSLRHLLGAELGSCAADIAFSLGTHGKPSLATRSDGRNLHFNLSHSQHLALVAITDEAEVGVDLESLESIAEGEDLSNLATRVFSAQELQHWRRLAKNLRRLEFMRTWVRKEAFAKATGEGLHFELGTIEIIARPNDTLTIRGTPAEKFRGWNVRDLPVGNGFVGAIAWRDS